MVAGQVSSPQTQTRAQQAGGGIVTPAPAPARAVRAPRRCSTKGQGEPRRGRARLESTAHLPHAPVDPFRPNDGATAHLRWGFQDMGLPRAPRRGSRAAQNGRSGLESASFQFGSPAMAAQAAMSGSKNRARAGTTAEANAAWWTGSGMDKVLEWSEKQRHGRREAFAARSSLVAPALDFGQLLDDGSNGC
ncbi:hypothetical protein CSOJ01_06829 [Colletotrichum sojae]|uniref:Uncharacterized protein n=1 Tax=Colletotrichum sojae TaxID=2175907 RepID=A0A8H6MV76_9PEZI|nr:hypothetical protein CSOJ01_06829 [Colletotrichum sojae]